MPSERSNLPPSPPAAAAQSPTDCADTTFAAWWNAVLTGDENAKTEAMQLVRKAVQPMLQKRFPSLDADEITASIQRTLLRRIAHDPDSIATTSFAHFRNSAKQRARFKALNQMRKSRPGSLPDVVDESGESKDYEPADHREKSPVDAAIENAFVDGFLFALEARGEPDYSIGMGWFNDLLDDQIASRLVDLGYTFTVAAIRMRRIRLIERISQSLNDEDQHGPS